MNKNLTISTSSARPHKPATACSRDAQDIASAVSRAAKLAVNKSMESSASLRDAKLRRVVEKHKGAVVADGLAGDALAEMARQCEQDGALVANDEQTGAPDPAEYFAERKPSGDTPDPKTYFGSVS